METLIRRDQGVPDLFRYTHETGYISTAIDWWTWQDDIADHRHANKLDPITPEQAEDQLCKTLPPGHCEHDSTERSSHVYVDTRLRWSEIAAGAVAYTKFMLSGFKGVAQSEADRRARICSGCYLRVTPQGCRACIKLGRLIVGEVAKKKTAYDQHLIQRACGACKCPLQPLVHFTMPMLEEAETPELQNRLPNFCWRKRAGLNYMSQG